MCSNGSNEKGRGKVPSRDYSVTEDGDTRRLQRIIPHGPDACIDSGAATGYLNQPSVMAAIHVRDPGFCWAVCNTGEMTTDDNDDDGGTIVSHSHMHVF